MKNLKRTIAIVCGGDSSEHDVSLRSAQGLYSFFDKERYNVYIVDIKGQDWHVELPDGTTAKIDRNGQYLPALYRCRTDLACSRTAQISLLQGQTALHRSGDLCRLHCRILCFFNREL